MRNFKAQVLASLADALQMTHFETPWRLQITAASG